MLGLPDRGQGTRASEHQDELFLALLTGEGPRFVTDPHAYLINSVGADPEKSSSSLHLIGVEEWREKFILQLREASWSPPNHGTPVLLRTMCVEI